MRLRRWSFVGTDGDNNGIFLDLLRALTEKVKQRIAQSIIICVEGYNRSRRPSHCLLHPGVEVQMFEYIPAVMEKLKGYCARVFVPREDFPWQCLTERMASLGR